MRTLLENATLIDGTGAGPVPASSVLVEDGRIAAVGRAADFGSMEADIRHVDLSGSFLLPGFVNAHDHVTNKRVRGTRAEKARQPDEMLVVIGIRNALVNLGEGVTTLRDAGSRAGLARHVKTALDAKRIIGPTMVMTPRGLTATAGYSHLNGVEVDTPMEARKAAGQFIKEGGDWIKCMASIEWERGTGEPISAVNMEMEVMRAAFEIAHHHGKPCMAHAVHGKAIANAVEAGADSIEHGIMLDLATAETMAARGTFLVPTLSGYFQHCADWGRGEGVIRHGRLLQEHHGHCFRNALAAGVRIAFGTDTLGTFAEEARLMQANGVTPMACVVAATLTGAELLGMADRIGTVSVGKDADLVVLNANPLDGPDAFGDVRFVMKAGRLFTPAQLPI